MGKLVFAADDGVNGRELWLSDSTTGETVLLADLNPGLASSNPDSFTTLAGRVVFIATSATGGRELWSVGHSGAPVQLMDVAAGATSSSPIILAVIGDRLFFTANNATVGRELYVTDGTVAGTSLVKDIRPGVNTSSITFVGTAGDHIVFVANDGATGREMWASDGTAAGTVLLADANAGAGGIVVSAVPNTNPPVTYVPTFHAGSLLYYSIGTPATGQELWVTDGTASGTRMVQDIQPGATGSQPSFVGAIGSKVFFTAASATAGRELWVTDGGQGATVLTSVPDFYSSPTGGTVIDGNLYFLTPEGGGNNILWRTDGTVGGTHRLTPPGVSASGEEFFEVEGGVIFAARTADQGVELWITGGQPGDAQLLKELAPSSFNGHPRDFYQLGDRVVFEGGTSTNGRAIWVTDGTTAGTTLIKDLGSAESDAFRPIGEVGGRILFKTSTSNGIWTIERLWSTDGTSAGTLQLVEYVQDFPRLELPTDFIKVGDRYVYVAGHPSMGRELWTTDGTQLGTRPLLNSMPGGANGEFADFRLVDGILYFTSRTATSGTELWRTDGTVAGTALVQDINTIPDLSPATSFDRDYSPFKDGAMFHLLAEDGTYQLWFSDGSAAGTVRLTEGDASPYPVTVVGEIGLFYGSMGNQGLELWVTDGAPEGTHITVDLEPGPGSGVSSYVRVLDGKAIFPAAGKAQLWLSDGTAAGTVKLMDAGSGSANIATMFEDRLFFVVTTPAGSAMWVTDGSVSGTVALAAVNTPQSGFAPFDGIVRAGDGWLFAGRDAGGQSELWFTDGTAAGTQLFLDVAVKSTLSGLVQFAVVGEKTFFIADDGDGIPDLWITDGSSAGTTKLAAARVFLGLEQQENNWGVVPRHEVQTVGGDRVLFMQGTTLWASDGTVAGTVQLTEPLNDELTLTRIKFVDGRAYIPTRPNVGNDLWVTDGTAEGTARLTQTWLNYAASFFNSLATYGGDFVFVAFDGVGQRLFATDGTLAGTRIISNVAPNGDVIALGDRLIYQGREGTDQDHELWSVGADGAVKIDIAEGARGSWPHKFQVLNGVAYFIADAVGDRFELWRTDGTGAGTWRVVDLKLGGLDAYDLYLQVVAGKLVFLADDGINGEELWTSDGTAEGTVRLTDTVTPGSSTPGPVIALPEPLTLTGDARNEAITGSSSDEIIEGLGGNDILYGMGGNDVLDGGAGNDRLDGGAGADRLAGGLGDDVYVVQDTDDLLTENAGEGVDRVQASVSWTLGANFEVLQLTGTLDIDGTGNELANTIEGNSGSNVLSGGGGNDIIRGGGGADSASGDDGADQLLGGDGDDTIYGGGDNDRLQGEAGDDLLYGGAGADILDGGAQDDTLHGEAGADQLNGGVGSDILYGGGENDRLDGGAGADRMEGGAGDDNYFVDDAGDSVIEQPGEGVDTVRATVSFTLGAEVERLQLLGVDNLSGTGNELANILTGNSGDNILDGGAGKDTLTGGDGADTLIGGSGSDLLTGGAGADRFVVLQASINLGGAPEIDTVTDFVAGQDIIDLSAIDSGNGGAFAVVGAFSGQAGQMTLSFAGGATTLSLDVDGDRVADYRMKINGNVTGDYVNWSL